MAVLFSCKKIGNGGIYEAGKRNGDCSGVPFAAWVWYLYGNGTFLMYRDGEQEYDTLREYVAVEEPKERKDGETPEENQEETVTVDFEALKK